MEGIEKITAKILSDAQADIDQLNAQTQEKADAIARQAQARPTKRPPTSWPGGRRPPTTGLERLSSAAQMEKRKLALAAKQEVLGEAFDLALDKLCSLPEEEYIALLTRLAVEASETGKEQLVFSETDRARVGKQVVIAANECLVKGWPRTARRPGRDESRSFVGQGGQLHRRHGHRHRPSHPGPGDPKDAGRLCHAGQRRGDQLHL